MRSKGLSRLLFAVVLMLAAYSTISLADSGELKITASKGKAVIMTANGFERTAYTGLSLRQGDMIKTYKDATVEITAPTGDVVTILEISAMTINEASFGGKQNKQSMSMDVGKMYAQVNKLKVGSKFEVETPFAIAGVRGTLFSVESDGDSSTYRCLQGSLTIKKDGRSYIVNEGEELVEDMNGVHGPRPIPSESLEKFQRDLEKMSAATGNQGYLKQAVESVQKIAASRPGEKLWRPFQPATQTAATQKIEPAPKPSAEKSESSEGGTSSGGKNVQQTSLPPKPKSSSFSETETLIDINVRAQASVKFESKEEKVTEEEKDKEKNEALVDELTGKKDEDVKSTGQAQAQPGDNGGVDDKDKPGEGPTTMDDKNVSETAQGAGLEDDKPGRDRDETADSSGTKNAEPSTSDSKESTPMGTETETTGGEVVTTTPPPTTTTTTETTPGGTGGIPSNEELAEGIATGLPTSGGGFNPIVVAVVQTVTSETSEAGNPGL